MNHSLGCCLWCADFLVRVSPQMMMRWSLQSECHTGFAWLTGWQTDSSSNVFFPGLVLFSHSSARRQCVKYGSISELETNYVPLGFTVSEPFSINSFSIFMTDWHKHDDDEFFCCSNSDSAVVVFSIFWSFDLLKRYVNGPGRQTGRYSLQRSVFLFCFVLFGFRFGKEFTFQLILIPTIPSQHTTSAQR